MAEYFGPTTDESIARYNSSDDVDLRKRIFTHEICPVFQKLIESLIFTYKFHGIDDLQTLKDECLVHLYEMLPKFDSTRGSKGFSYFNVVAKNWFMHKFKERKRREINESDLPGWGLSTSGAGDDVAPSKLDQKVPRHMLVAQPFQDEIIEKEFWVSFYNDIDKWSEHLVKPVDRRVLDAMIFLLKNPNIASIYSKKAIIIYLRDITGLNSKQISGSMKRIRGLYIKFKDGFFNE
jgi:hypothetical protein